MKKIITTFILCFAFILTQSQTLIKPSIFGQNCHMPDYIGQYHAYGHLEDYWSGTATNYIPESKAKFMRYNGKDVEANCEIDGNLNANPASHLDLTILDYVSKAKSIWDNGMTPILTAPLKLVGDITDFQTAAEHSAKLVKAVNEKLVTDLYPPVTRWAISNEPDGSPHNFSAATIKDYTQKYKTEIDALWNNAWGNKILMGPELAGWSTSLIDDLTLTGTYDITPYIDVFTFHYYPFQDQGSTNSYWPDPTPQNVIEFIQNPCTLHTTTNISTPLATYTGTGGNHLDYLRSRIPSSCQIGITEANICYRIDHNHDEQDGTGSNSFIAGQFWAELMGVCMENNVDYLNFWSVVEGTSSDNYETNNGYINYQPTLNAGNDLGNNERKSTYWHYQMVASHFFGNYEPGSSNISPEVKSFASVNPGEFFVLILNQDDIDHDFEVKFFSAASFAGSDLKITYDFQNETGILLDQLYVYPSSFPIKAHSTVLLQIDCQMMYPPIRIDYTEDDYINHLPPIITQVGNVVIDPDIGLCNSGISGAISENTTYYGDTIYVSGDLFVDDDVTLKFDSCIVVVDKDLKIQGDYGSSIELKNCVMVGCEGNQWEGIILQGTTDNHGIFSSLNSLIVNARKPITTEGIPEIDIESNIFVNGDTAIDITSGKDFYIYGNIIAGYDVGIRTRNSQSFQTLIKENHFFEINTDMSFKDDSHDQLEISCNEFHYRDESISSIDTDLKDQGDSLVSAGNKFIQEEFGQPVNYLVHAGNLPTYYYGPLQSSDFSYPNIMNVPVVMAASDKVCKTVSPTSCLPIGIEETSNATSQLLIYPNPNNGTFTIELPSSSSPSTISVCDMLGKEIHSQKISAHTQKINLDIDYAKGIYFVRLHNSKQNMVQRLIIE
jgi:hypothetical protein